MAAGLSNLLDECPDLFDLRSLGRVSDELEIPIEFFESLGEVLEANHKEAIFEECGRIVWVKGDGASEGFAGSIVFTSIHVEAAAYGLEQGAIASCAGFFDAINEYCGLIEVSHCDVDGSGVDGGLGGEGACLLGYGLVLREGFGIESTGLQGDAVVELGEGVLLVRDRGACQEVACFLKASLGNEQYSEARKGFVGECGAGIRGGFQVFYGGVGFVLDAGHESHSGECVCVAVGVEGSLEFLFGSWKVSVECFCDAHCLEGLCVGGPHGDNFFEGLNLAGGIVFGSELEREEVPSVTAVGLLFGEAPEEGGLTGPCVAGSSGGQAGDGKEEGVFILWVEFCGLFEGVGGVWILGHSPVDFAEFEASACVVGVFR